MDNASSVIQIRDLVRETAQPYTGEAIHFAVIPKDSQAVSLRDFQYPHGLPPARIVAAPKFQDAESFCSYVNSFKDHRTRVLADAPAALFLALIDYHGAGADSKPEFVSHRATLQLKKSEEWNIWMGNNDKLIPQADFAEFIEDNRADVVVPDSATMLEIAKDLQAHSEVNFASKINTKNGAAVLNFEETIKASVSTGSIEVPETFTIRIPVFYGEPAIEIQARLRFRISDGKLRFQYKLYRPVEILSGAFDVARGGVAQAVTLEVLLGTL